MLSPKRWLVKLLIATLVVAGLAGPARARSLEEILKAGEIRVGVNPTLPPLALINEKNELDGFDVEVAGLLAKKLGVKLVLERVGSPDRIPFVVADKIDFVMGAMTRTAERAKVIDFSVPVHTEQFGVLTTDKKSFKALADLNKESVTMIQVRGTTPIAYIEKNLPKAKILQLDNYPDVIKALADGRGDAMLDVVDFVGKYMNQYKNVKWRVLETGNPGDVYYCALGVAKGNYALRDWLNVALYDLHRDGSIDQTWLKWFARPMLHKVKWSDWF
jgi:polar amino acid transport system substrate-binding protein